VGEKFYAIGRNADGTWLQLQRTDRVKRVIGWLAVRYTDFEFDRVLLPITDSTTGLIGDVPVTDVYNASVVTLAEVKLRADANVRSAEITVIPYDVIVPALEVYPDLTWVKVNYLGQIGWVAGFLVRTPADILERVPIPEGLERTVVGVEIVPPELQLAQLERLRDFVEYRRQLADDMAYFWGLVKKGETVPCSPPGYVESEYAASFQDYKELPEMRRYLPRLRVGVESLNKAIEILQPCGTYTDEQVNEAYAGAINARVIFDTTLEQLDFLEEFVIPKVKADK
jgi:uncharacterized protein YraI